MPNRQGWRRDEALEANRACRTIQIDRPCPANKPFANLVGLGGAGYRPQSSILSTGGLGV